MVRILPMSYQQMIGSSTVGPKCNDCGCYVYFALWSYSSVNHGQYVWFIPLQGWNLFQPVLFVLLHCFRHSSVLLQSSTWKACTPVIIPVALLMSGSEHPLPLGMGLWRCPWGVTGVLCALQNTVNKIRLHHSNICNAMSYGTRSVPVRVLERFQSCPG